MIMKMQQIKRYDETNEIARSPTLQTVMMVEKFIKQESGEYKKTELFNKLPKKVMWQTFQVIMEYLESINKIIYDNEGYVVYVWNPELYEKFKNMPAITSLTMIKKKIIKILKENNITRAGIFGSYGKGKAKKTSDIDILIELKPDVSLLGIIRLKMLLEKATKKNVDLVEYETIKPQIREKILNEEVRII